jgi:Tfp pilus assembly protein PilF
MTEDAAQPRHAMTNRKKRLLLISAGLVIATIIAYEPVRHNGFVGYDDDGYITNNPDVLRGLTQQSVIWAFTTSHTGYPHPITWLSLMLDVEIYGLNAPGHHITSVLIHISNALLLFWILTNLTGSIWPSAFVAAVFALHPLQVESVAWASERKTVLSTLFWMLTIWAYVRYTRSVAVPVTGKLVNYGLVLVFFAMGMMAKPSVVTLPLVLLLLDYWPLNRLPISDCRLPIEKQKLMIVSWKSAIIEKIPLLGLSAILSVITVIAQREAGAMSPLTNVSFDARIINVFVSYIRYIHKLIWPSGLAVFYPHYQRNFGDAIVIFSIFVFSIITIVCLYLGRKKKYTAVGWLWFVGTLVPMIGLVQVGAQAMANRYMYISMMGLLIIIAWSVKELIANYPGLKYAAAVSAAAVLSVAVILTRTQVKHWENNLTLFGYALEVTDRNFLAESCYGMALVEKQQPREAVPHLKKAIKISPGFSDAYSNLGTAYILLGRNKEAVKYLQKAIELKSDNTKALNNYAWLLATQKEVSAEDAAKSFELAFRACELTKHKYPELLDTLAVAYAAAGRFAEAIKISNQAIDIAKVTRQENLVDEIQSRIKLYKEGQRYYQK